MMLRSNSANTASIPNNARPAGVVVSTACRSRYRSQPLALSSARKPTRSCSDLPRQIDRPGGNDVNAAPGDGLMEPIKAGPLLATLVAADTGILECLDDAPAARLAGRCQCLALVLEGLIVGADPEIEADPFPVHVQCFLYANGPHAVYITRRSGDQQICGSFSRFAGRFSV